MGDSQAHSSYLTWLIFRFRAIEKILPSLKQKGKYGWAAPVALCILVLFAMLGFGIYIDGYIIHPPAVYTGVCPPPAQIRGGGCVLITVQVVTVSGTLTTVTQTQQAGQILVTTTTGGH